MDNSHSYVALHEIRIDPTFSNLFPRRQHVLDGLKQHIEANGFGEAFPLIIGDGPWADHDVLIDGHSRLQVC